MKAIVWGAGAIGLQRIQALCSNPKITEVLVHDPAKTPVLPVKARFISQEESYSTTAELAIIATPHDVAARILPKAAEKIPFILLEKPLGRTGAEALELMQAAEKNQCRLFVGFNYRFLKNIQTLKSLIKAGSLGKFLGADCVLAHGANPGYEKSWKTDFNQCGGGVCIDPGVHVLDLLTWLVGPLQLQSGALSKCFWEISVEDHAHLQLQTREGALANVSLSISSWKSRFEMTFEFEHSQVLIRGRGKFYGDLKLVRVEKWPWLKPEAPRETEMNFGAEDLSFKSETDEFVRVASGGVEDLTIATAEESLQIMQLVDACYRLPRLWESNK